jgi:hypothetical protein
LKSTIFYLDADYWKVTVLNVFVFFLIVGVGLGVLLFFNRACWFFWLEFQRLFSFLFLLLLSRIIRKKGLHLGLNDVLLGMGF